MIDHKGRLVLLMVPEDAARDAVNRAQASDGVMRLGLALQRAAFAHDPELERDADGRVYGLYLEQATVIFRDERLRAELLAALP